MQSEYENYYLLNVNTLEEVCQKYNPGFSFFAAPCNPGIFAGGTYPWHWHSYVQFFYVEKGIISYRTAEGIHTFQAGDGGYINAGILHMLTSDQQRENRYVEILFEPSLLGSISHSDVAKYIQAITDDGGFEIFCFRKEESGHAEALHLLREVFELYSEKRECHELLIRSKLSMLWVELYILSKGLRDRPRAKHTSSRLKTMLLYINEHYAEKISLDQLAEASSCSRRECNRAFQNELHTTPFQYLQEIRMNKATGMLVNTDKPISQISEDCGFSDPSHFTKAFKAQSGMLPKQFRQRYSAQHGEMPTI